MKISEQIDKVRLRLNKPAGKKPPPHEWQETALRVIEELGIPPLKRNAVFRVCKLKPKPFIEACLAETKELCRNGTPWKYFFKLTGKKATSIDQGKKEKLK